MGSIIVGHIEGSRRIAAKFAPLEDQQHKWHLRLQVPPLQAASEPSDVAHTVLSSTVCATQHTSAARPDLAADDAMCGRDVGSVSMQASASSCTKSMCFCSSPAPFKHVIGHDDEGDLVTLLALEPAELMRAPQQQRHDSCQTCMSLAGSCLLSVRQSPGISPGIECSDPKREHLAWLAGGV